MIFKVKLVRSTFLFGKTISLVKGVEREYDLDELSLTDLIILANKVLAGDVESTVDYNTILTKISELSGSEDSKPSNNKKQEDSTTRISSTEESKIEVIEVENEDEDESPESEDCAIIRTQIVEAPTSIAIKSIKLFSSEKDKEFFELALKMESASKSRQQVIKNLQSAIKG